MKRDFDTFGDDILAWNHLTTLCSSVLIITGRVERDLSLTYKVLSKTKRTNLESSERKLESFMLNKKNKVSKIDPWGIILIYPVIHTVCSPNFPFFLFQRTFVKIFIIFFVCIVNLRVSSGIHPIK